MTLRRCHGGYIKRDPKGSFDIILFNRQLPGQKDLRSHLLGREIGLIKTSCASLDDGMRLAGIEHDRRSPDKCNSMTSGRKVKIRPAVLAQEDIAKGCAAIVRTVMVVGRSSAGHQSHL